MKVNYSLVGLGGIAKIHLMGLRNIPLLDLQLDTEINLDTVLTTHKSQNYQYAKSIGFVNIVETLEGLLRIPDINIVDICTPNYLHKEQIIASIKAQKHVYCEKPLALNRSEGKQILDVLENTSVHNQMGFVLRFLPAVARARAMLKNNVLGKVYTIRAEIYHSSYLNPQKKMTWRLDRQKSGGGALADLGSHMIDLVHFLLGEFATVQAWIDTIVSQRAVESGEMKEVDVDDWALLMIKLKNGIKGTIEASRIAVGNEGIRIEIYGEKGCIYLNPSDPYFPKVFDEKSKEIFIDDELIKKDKYVHELLKIYPSSKLSQGWMVDSHTASLAWFLRNIEKNNKDLSTPDFREGYKTQTIIDCGYDSAKKEGIPIIVDY